MRAEVVVVGSFNQDLTWRCARFPRAGETVLGEFLTGPGGKGSNQAVAAARAGAATCFVGAMGRDAFAAEAKRFYRREGIAVRLALKAKEPTGTAGILVAEGGENEIIVALGANRALARRDIDLKLVRAARIVLCQLETNLETTAYVLRAARRAGVATVLNPAPMRADFDPAILGDVDILIPNETEFLELVRRVPRAAAEADERFRSDMGCLAGALMSAVGMAERHRLCRALGVPTVIVTLGSRGCLVSTAGGFAVVPAHRVEAVDTTGAGDAFVGGFAAGYVRGGGDVMAAAKYGNAVAALAVTRRGTAPAMPRRAEVERLIENRRQRGAGGGS